MIGACEERQRKCPLLYRGQCQAAPLVCDLVLFCSPYAPADDTAQGSRFTARSAVRPPHDGLRRMGRYNLTGALAAGQQQDRRTLRTPPTRRPREDIFLPEQIRYLLACNLCHRLKQPEELRRCACSSGTRYHRPTCGAEPRPGAGRPRRWLDASRAAGPPVYPTPSATTISCHG